MGNVQAQGLDHGGAFFEIYDFVPIGVLRKQSSLFFQFFYVLKDFPDLLFFISIPKLPKDFFPAICFEEGNCLISQIIYHVNGSAVYI